MKIQARMDKLGWIYAGLPRAFTPQREFLSCQGLLHDGRGVMTTFLVDIMLTGRMPSRLVEENTRVGSSQMRTNAPGLSLSFAVNLFHDVLGS